MPSRGLIDICRNCSTGSVTLLAHPWMLQEGFRMQLVKSHTPFTHGSCRHEHPASSWILDDFWSLPVLT